MRKMQMSGDVSAAGSYPVGQRRWTAVAEQDSGQPDNELTHVVCLKRGEFLGDTAAHDQVWAE
jgi:hypothetical protein